MKMFSDAGDAGRARQTAEELCGDGDHVVLVIGYVETTVANAALEYYSKCGMPVILVATTGSGVTKWNQKGNSGVVLQLPPSNIQQASHVFDALADTFGRSDISVLILIDPDNRDYSADLVNEFTRLAIANQSGWRLSPTRFDEHVIRERWESGADDAMLMFGMTDKAVALAHIIRASRVPAKLPIVVVTDGATNAEFIEQAGKDAEGIWGSFPVGEQRNKFIAQSNKQYGGQPNFYYFGFDSVLVARRCLLDASLPSSDRSQDGDAVRAWRRAISESMRQVFTSRQFIKGDNGYYEFGPEGRLRFLWDDEGGNNSADQFHMWRVTEGRWRHRVWREPLKPPLLKVPSTGRTQ
jgi:ABC-type branched-subunit amino acid transport system substrate-binding protein